MRAYCSRCCRPESVCYCAWLQSIETPFRVVVLMHPDEQRRRVATGRMAHLCLPNSELIVGETFAHHPRVADLLRQQDCWLLYPGGDAKASALMASSVSRSALFVLDGKWAQARKMLAGSPNLAALPRISFSGNLQSHFTIKRQPKRHCLSTLEAITAVLAEMPKDPAEGLKLLVPFFHVVNQQLAFEFSGAPTSRVERSARKRPDSDVLRCNSDRLLT